MSTSDDPAALRADIEQTRQELGDSVEELAARADVKERVGEKAAEVADTVRRRPGRVATVAAGFAALFGGIALLRRRRAKARAHARRRWWSR